MDEDVCPTGNELGPGEATVAESRAAEKMPEPTSQSEHKLYALVSHESAIDAIWWHAEHGWKDRLDDEGAWMVPAPESCVKSQGDFKRLAKEVDLPSLGITHDPLDLLVPNASCFSRGKRARFHVWKDFFPPRSFLRVHDRIFVSTPYFIVLQLSAAAPPTRLMRARAEEAARQDATIRAELGLEGRTTTPSELRQWENNARLVGAAQVLCDFAGTYRYVPGTGGIRYETKPLLSRDSFSTYLASVEARKGAGRARRVAELAFDGAASPMETMLALMLTLPVELGGFGLPRPQLNREIPVDPSLRELVSQEALFADLSWPDARVAVEYYGWEEHFGAGPQKVGRDAARANSLVSLGWTVLHVTYEQVKTLAGMTLLARQVAHALGVELAEPDDLQRVWRSRLLALLLPESSREGE